MGLWPIYNCGEAPPFSWFVKKPRKSRTFLFIQPSDLVDFGTTAPKLGIWPWSGEVPKVSVQEFICLANPIRIEVEAGAQDVHIYIYTCITHTYPICCPGTWDIMMVFVGVRPFFFSCTTCNGHGSSRRWGRRPSRGGLGMSSLEVVANGWFVREKPMKIWMICRGTQISWMIIVKWLSILLFILFHSFISRYYWWSFLVSMSIFEQCSVLVDHWWCIWWSFIS